MHTGLSPRNTTETAHSNRRRNWVILVWVVLMIKSLFLSMVIEQHEVPIGHLWIWGPSIIAALLLSVYVGRKS